MLIISIKPEHTGKGNYGDFENCPLAMGLKDKGFRDVAVGHYWWSATKGFWPFKKRIEGHIPELAGDTLREIADTAQPKPTILALPDHCPKTLRH